MMVPHVTTEAGRSVKLRFDDDRVEVRPVSEARQRAVRACAGGLLLGFGLAAVAVNAGDRGITGLDLALWVAVGVAVLAAAGGAVWWFLVDRRDRRHPGEMIATSSVSDARSTAEAGQVTVSLQLADGAERSFSAVGHSGALLSAAFSRLLTVSGPPAA
ncbi:hypothetical protein [Actinoplanes sp. M2I2]|uniref:hypothetical protein n=1 Tax=Actinoplanes sp. M2I2 TaxID=1734444 RepID=UPI0020220C6A|nr:hypothetical protein [Actinoplanes sp. M2I2]